MFDRSGRSTPVAAAMAMGLCLLALPAAGAGDADAFLFPPDLRDAPQKTAEAADKSIAGTLQVVAGYGGKVRYNEGAGWKNLPDPGGYPSTGNIYRLDALGLDNIWVCGDEGVRSFDGTAWSPLQLAGNYCFSIMVRPDGVVACTTAGMVWRKIGSAWEAIGDGSGSQIYGVWGLSADDFWICGTNGLIKRYRQGQWTTLAAGTTAPLYSVWGAPGVGPFFVGNSGILLVYRNGAISAIPTGTTTKINNVHGTSGTNVWACGDNGRVWFYNGTTVQEHHPGATTNMYWAVSALPNGMVTIGGYNGSVQHYDGATWSTNNDPESPYIITMASLPARDNAGWWDGFAAAPRGQGLSYDTSMGIPISQALHDGKLVVHGMFNGAAGQTAANIAAFDGSSWEVLPDVAAPPQLLTQSLTRYQGNLIVVEDAGTNVSAVRRLVGGSWQQMGATIPGDVFVIKSLTIGGQERLYLAGAIPHPVYASQSAVLFWNSQTSEWLPAGSGCPEGQILGLAEFGGSLFASIWNAYQIMRLAAGNQAGVWEQVFSSATVNPLRLLSHQGSLYVGCRQQDGNHDLLRRYVPGGSLEWQGLGAMATGNAFVLDLASWGDRIAMAGSFSQLGEVVSPGAAFYEAGALHGFGTGLTTYQGGLSALALAGDVYFCGYGLVAAGTCESWGIARWRDLDPQETSPRVTVTLPATVAVNQPLTMTASVASYQTVQDVSLAFRAHDEQDYRYRTMTRVPGPGSPTFQAVIPDTSVTSLGVQYVVTARTSQATAAAPGYAGVGVAFDVLVDTPLRYELIGVPFVPLGNMRQILEDDLGSYQPSKWRLEHWDAATQRYLSYPSVPPFAPGRGYYLIQRDPVTIDISGTTTNTVGGTTIPLQPGWNMIAAPYLFSVPWEDVTRPALLEDQLIARTNDAYEPRTTLDPWRGYFVYLGGASPDSLTVPVIAPGKAAAAEPPLEGPAVEPTELPGCDWIIAIAAAQGDRRDLPKIAGALAAPDDGPGDLHQPPSLPHDLSVWLEREETDGVHQLRRDLRLVGGGAVWDLVVRPAEGGQPVVLTFTGLDHVPALLDVALVTPQGAVDLRRAEGSWQGALAGQTRLRLVVGDGELIEEAASTLPQPYALLPAYPNPFNPATTVAFTLPRTDLVRLDVYDVAGRRVRTLVNEVRGPGRHIVAWDGIDGSGRGLSSGTYLLRLEAGDFSQVRKLTLVR